MAKLCFFLIILLAANHVICQTTDGFVNIDCGNTKNYTDPSTKFVYTPDDQYIDTGTIFNIGDNYKSEIYYQTDLNLRSFPNGDRNCYTLKPAVKGNMYLIRATFFYGNYDGFNSIKSKNPILFDLHIGVNYWRTVNVSDAAATYEHEAMTVALADFLSVCLIKTGHGTPFINSLEMRPLKSTLYPTVTAIQFTDLYARTDFGGSKITRYPNDKYDRIWYPLRYEIWENISTSQKVSTNNIIVDVPSSVLQTAIIPSKSSPNPWSLDFGWTSEDANPPFYVNLHFAEIQLLPNSGKREFTIYFNRKIWYDHMIPEYLSADTIYSIGQLANSTDGNEYEFSLNATSNATVPPLINGIEVFSLLQVTNAMTDLADVEAILAIKSEYKVNKSWSGDPCAPVNYSWAGVGCSSHTSDSPKIISLNLSSSGLTGSLSSSFSNLQNIKILDLSYNKLNGTIPDFLSTMTSLQVLNLSCNNFTGPVPDALEKKSKSGLLKLTNGNICTYTKPDSNSKKSHIVVIVSVAVGGVIVVVILLILFFLFCKRKPRLEVQTPIPVPDKVIEIQEVQLKTRKYTKQELVMITANFTSQIGQGGFGSVFAGTLNNGTRVAVKKLSETSTQGLKQFRTEAENLATLHHRNLVSLVGYCEDESCVSLVYEYMPQGSLEDHIKGDRRYGRGLDWKERLHVVLEAAEGLDYLHRGCSVPIVHRDVKSSNILIGGNLEAKVSDLGLARAFHGSTQKGTLATAICGTRGYIDPEYYTTGMLTEKSDVYSFGVVLMEIITGQSAVQKGPKGDFNLTNNLKERMKREDITSIIDSRFQGNYDINSAWKVMELALSCTHDTSAPRPTMAEVVAQLIIIKEMESSQGGKSEGVYSSETSIGYNNTGFGNDSDMFGPSAR